MASGILADMTRSDIEEFQAEVAVWPVASTEAHGPHLPFATDALVVEALLRRAVPAANERGAHALLLPTMPYGINTNLLGFPYTLTVKPSTLAVVARDLIETMVTYGVPKFLMVNGHGGNTDALKALCREFTDRDIFLATINGWALAADVVAEVIETESEHACEFETSLALALFPDLVARERIAECPTRECRLKKLLEYGGSFTRPWEKFTFNSGVGHPEKATREKGERIVEALVERLAEVLVELGTTERDAMFPY